ncbi:recombinase family protein [Lacticaseibacillus jixiensis]|uniref:recombinase family protein n=1 Tax=Lacticaseibacillus jixiensis TaxID=3231926 RepID=UPI0036F2E98F
MKVGYARVSSTGQKLDRQLVALKEYGVEEDGLFVEKRSGKNITQRTELKKAMTFVRRGDELVVVSLDRLSRNYDDVGALVKKLRDKQVTLTVLDAPFLNMNTGNKTLDKFLGDLMIGLLGYIAQNEREKNHQRQAEGIRIAKEKGKYKGRPARYAPDARTPEQRMMYAAICQDLDAGKRISDIAHQRHVSRQQVYRIRDRHAANNAGRDVV